MITKQRLEGETYEYSETSSATLAIGTAKSTLVMGDKTKSRGGLMLTFHICFS